ncbi:hypothetical protein BKA70DRAFT_1357614 [Coprinopsis sp. MPI-PUGE-AT-0042]|nr:hypothetical protein BKA70DRAFT_1357614 [Coprinopsis sp. MPI-PUGE-AT-0042]
MLLPVIQSPNGLKYTLAAVDIFLGFLRPELIPSPAALLSPDSECIRRMDRGFQSVFGLQNIISQVQESSYDHVRSLSQSIVEKVIPHIDDVARWLMVAIRRPPPSFPPEFQASHPNILYISSAGWIITSSLDFSTDLGNAVRSSPLMIDVAVTLWLLKNKDVDAEVVYKVPPGGTDRPPDEYFVTPFPPSESGAPKMVSGCPLIVFMCSLLHDTSLRKGFIQSWVKYFGQVIVHGSKIDPFIMLARTITSRADQCYITNELRLSDNPYTWQSIRPLGDIVKWLTNHPDAIDECEAYGLGNRNEPLVEPEFALRMLLALHKADYISKFTLVAQSISSRGYVEESSRGFPEIRPSQRPYTVLALEFENHLLFKTLFQASYAADEAYCAFLKSGLLEIAAHTAANLVGYSLAYRDRIQGEPGMMAASFVRTTFTYAITFPKVARMAIKQSSEDLVFRKDGEALSWALTKNFGKLETLTNGKASDWWYEFRSQLEQWDQRHREFKLSWKFNICDSEKHHERQEDPLHSSEHLQRCSGCDFNVYCSSICQMDDWKKRHRFECKNLSRFYKSLRDSDISYRPHLRAWHIHILKSLFIDHNGFKGLLVSPPGAVARFGLNNFPVTFSRFPVTAYRIRAPLVLSFLDDRFATDFLYWAAQAPKFEPVTTSANNPKTVVMKRLIEGIFNFGDKIIILTLKVVLKGSGDLGDEDHPEIIVLDSMTRMCANQNGEDVV